MADIWSGDIALPNGDIIADITLTTPTASSLFPAAATAANFLPQTHTLRFLATVDPSRIPLYLAAGPSLDVSTARPETESWFASILLSAPAAHDTNDEWTMHARAQAPIGILVEVQSTESFDKLTAPAITEVLFYGTIAPPPLLPTPSSSPEILDEIPELRVHALPLSSALLNAPILPPSPLHDTEPRFLAPLQHAHKSQPLLPPPLKRDLFEEATIARKKARGKGGEGVAAAAARGSETQPQMGYARRRSEMDLKLMDRPRTMSREPSVASTGREAKRSGLAKVAAAVEDTIEARNKEALSKVVMAAMRMHGLQQRKKNKGEETTAEDAVKDEEYKLIYHQTYKGAALALRNYMAEKPLHAQSDKLRDLVEKLLVIFLSDPLEEPPPPPLPEPTHPAATPVGKQLLGVLGSTHHASPFDLPSGSRHSTSRPPMMRSKTEGHVNTGSPVSRRKPQISSGMLDDS